MEYKVLEGLVQVASYITPGDKCPSILSHRISHYLRIHIRPRLTLAVRSRAESFLDVESSQDKFSGHGSIAKPLDEVCELCYEYRD
jgi:hypothetical protein